MTLGLGLTVFGCGDEGESDTGGDSIGDTVDPSDPTYEADAVTYAGPDPWWTSDDDGGWTTEIGTTTTTSNDSNDSWDADAVTYAGPDETDSIGDSWGTTTTGESSSSGGTESDTGDCEPITNDPSAIGNDCEVDADCPDGYTCQPFQGFVLQLSCQVLCEQTCQCSPGLTCNEVVDKSGVPWSQCG